jgi:pimeloyl-ACP methyl ester carboxylesterase
MGGAIAAAFAATFPERVRRVALLCPVGLLEDADLPRFAFRAWSAPVVQAFTASSIFRAYRRRQADAPGQDSIDEVRAPAAPHVFS